MEKVLIRYGELALKKKNKMAFVRALISDIKSRFSEDDEFSVKFLKGRIYLEYKDIEFSKISSILSRVFGIVSFSKVVEIDSDLEMIEKKAIEIVKKEYDINKFKSFKVNTKRSNKNFKLSSPEISAHLGSIILEKFDETCVDLHNPDYTLDIEIREKTYFFATKLKGLNGLPYGTSGKALSLLSGGIDSPVASFLAAKRGLKLEFLHFHSFPYTSQRSKEKVIKLAKIISKYTGNIRLYMINIAKVQEAIRDNCKEKDMTILGRRFMMRIAEKIAKRRKLTAIITGESLAQVASQTLEGMRATQDAIDMNIHKPLFSYDKKDIVDISKLIGTYDTSIIPHEDCCTIFLPKKVEVRPRLLDLEEQEKTLDYDLLISEALYSLEEFRL